MKALKKLTAIVLAVCMLIGMPLSIDVAATGAPNSAEFKLASGMIIPDSWGTSLDGDTQMSLYFTGGPITIDTSKVKVIVGIGGNTGWWDGLQLNRVLGVWLTGTLSQSDELLGGTASSGKKNPNNWVFTVNNEKTWPKADFKPAYQWAIEGDTVDTLTELKTLARLTGSNLIVKIIETDGTAGDGLIDGVTEGTTKLVANTNTANVNHGNLDGANDGAWAKVYDEQDAPQMTGAYLDDAAKTLNVRFNAKPDYGYRGNNYVWCGVRVLNNRGMIYCYDATNGFFTYKSASIADRAKLLSLTMKFEQVVSYSNADRTNNVYQLDDTQYNTIKDFQAKVAAHNATASADEQLKVSFILEENNGAITSADNTSGHLLVEGRGDGHQNHYVDSIWSGNVPYMPNFTDIDGWVADIMAQEVLSIDELKEQSVTIEKVTPVSRVGMSDRLIVEFSEAVNIPAINSYLRVFDGTGKLMTHDSATMKLTENGTSGYLQWGVSGWAKADADGKVWYADLSASYECDTYAEIVDYVSALKNADDTPATGLTIALSMVDPNGFKTYNNYRVDAVTAVADSSKKLFADNTQDSGEDRATSVITSALSVVDVEIYADEYVIMTFSDDIDIDAAIASMSTNAFWLGAHKNPHNGDNPVMDANQHIHTKLNNARKFGNATNKLLFDIGSWAALKERIDAYEAANGAVTVAVRVEGGGVANSVLVPGITSADGTLKLYRSNPDPSWGGRLMIGTELIPAVTVSNVKADTDKNMLIVTFSEPVKYTAQAVELKKASGGTYSAMRSQVALQRFKTADMTLDMANQYQSNATAYTASDADGNAVTDEYSTYWAFTFNEGVVETAVDYYADGNPAYTDEIGYGFGVFEASAGTGNDQITDLSLGLPLKTYCDDFATAPDANGSCKYLKASSTSPGVRFFKAVTSSVGTPVVPVTADSWKMIDHQNVQITFSEPVLVTSGGYNSIRVTEKNNLVGPDNAAYQLSGTMTAVNPDGDGYSAVWNFKASSSITLFAHDKFFNDAYSAKDGVTLCMSLQSNTGIVDGKTDHILSKVGGMLVASPYDHGAEGTYLNIGEDPMLTTDIITDVELIGQTDAMVTVTPIQNYGGTKSWRIIDGATGQTKAGAIWTIKSWQNYLNGNKQMLASDMNAALGVKTFDGIRGLMDADDKLVLAFSDTRVNGVIDNFYLTSAGGYKLQKATYSTATEDVAYFVVDVNSTKEALTVTDISAYERSTQTYTNQDRFLVFTFSHEISDEMLANIRSEQVQFWMTVKEVGSYNWWKDNGDGNGYVYNNNNPYHAKIAPTNFQRYGNTGNKLVAAVSGNDYVNLTNRVADINAKKGGNVAELSVRIETGKLSGLAGVNTLLKPVDTNVLPIVLDQGWNNGGRSYTPALNEGRKIQVGSIELIDGNKAEVNFVDESGNPVIVTNNLYNPGASGLYVAIRLTKDGKLAWSEKAQIAAGDTGSPLQFTGSIKTKNGTTADTTWVLSCNGLADLLQAMNDESGYYRKNGLDLAFALEGGNVPGTTDIADYIDVFTTLDGKGVLQMIKGDTVQAHRYFYSYLNHKNAWITNGFVKDTVKITKTEAVNNATLQVTFDQPVNIIGNQNWFRIVDGTNNLIRFDTATKAPIGNIMNVGEKDASGSVAGLAQVGTKTAKVDEEGKVWNFTINGGMLGNFGFANIVDFVAGLPATGNWNGGLRFALILEESQVATAVKNNGLTDHIVAADGSGAKLVNNQMGNYIGDGSCLDITADTVSDFVFANPLTVTSAKQINKNQLLVTFSEAVEIVDPWMGIRYVDENNELIYSNRDAQGNTIKDAGSKGMAMQWSKSKWEWNNDEHTEIVVTFKNDIGVILDGSNLPAALSPTTNPDYKYRFVIEETSPEQSGEASKSGLVCDVYAKADADNMLVNSYNFKKNAWDGHCVEITNVITPDTLITASDAKITGENQITFDWSHSVDVNNGGGYYAAFRYVNTETGVLYGNATDGWMQLGAYMNYVGSAMTKMTAHVTPNTKWGVYDIDDLLNPTGALKEYMDANPGKWVLCLEEMSNGGNGVIDTFFGKDGTGILADPFIGAWNDGVYIDITGTPITGELSVVDMAIISDTDVKVTFSAPIQFAQATNAKGEKYDSVPYVSMRLYNSNNQLLFWNPVTEEYTTAEQMKDKDGNRIYQNQNGYTTEKEGPNADGEWVPYKAMNNTPMQWASSWKWGDDKHTSVIYTLSGGAQLPVKNITDILSYDFTQFIEGSYVGFDIEENTPAMIAASGHVDNILRADNAKIALDANFFPHQRDSVMTRLEDMTLAYKPGKLVSKTEVISDTQIRVSFSQPVILDKDKAPFMAIRMIDKEGNLMWSGKENISQPYQWSGKWEWEDETHTSFIWTMTQVNLGASTIYDLANWKGVLQKYKNEGTWMFVIEELDKGDFKVGRHNGLVDNVTTKDCTIHLLSTYSKGLDGILTALDTSKLVGPELSLLSAQALDDQTIKLTFNEPVAVSDNVSMGVRYLSPSGDSEVLTDGKVAYFKGDWEYEDDTKKVIIWTLNSKSADNLTDIINYNGKFEWNKGARVAFVIMDAEEERGTPQSMRIKGIYDTESGFRTLVANYATEDYPMTQMDIEVLYDIPAPEASGDAALEEIVYVTNYVPFIIASAVIAVAGLVVAIVLFKKRKKNEQ